MPKGSFFAGVVRFRSALSAISACCFKLAMSVSTGESSEVGFPKGELSKGGVSGENLLEGLVSEERVSEERVSEERVSEERVPEEGVPEEQGSIGDVFDASRE